VSSGEIFKVTFTLSHSLAKLVFFELSEVVVILEKTG
jgi:hypothetical protein